MNERRVERKDVVLQAEGYIRHLRDHELEHDEHGLSVPFEYDGRWWKASHTLLQTGRHDPPRKEPDEWVVCLPATPPAAP